MSVHAGRFSERLVPEVTSKLWDLRTRGMTGDEIAELLDWKHTAVYNHLDEHGGIRPASARAGRSRVLSFAEREEIMVLRAQKLGVRQIATHLRRSPSTISRELRRGVIGRNSYRATTAHRIAFNNARRPKPARLLQTGPLRRRVLHDLAQRLSPDQISGRLARQFPDDPTMRISHESIYQAIYRDRLGRFTRREAALTRTGRRCRRPRRSPNSRTGHIQNMVPLRERSADATGRQIPGHIEGDLITGKANKSAIGTLVDRATGVITLLRIGNHKPRAHVMSDALVDLFTTMPAHLTRSLTWDQGVEMHRHVETTTLTGVPIYFCDARSPWQRGSNENANKLLRQYFPRGTNLATFTQAQLDAVARELNNRPRKRYGYATPNERLAELTVATTG